MGSARRAPAGHLRDANCRPRSLDAVDVTLLVGYCLGILATVFALGAQ